MRVGVTKPSHQCSIKFTMLPLNPKADHQEMAEAVAYRAFLKAVVSGKSD